MTETYNPLYCYTAELERFQADLLGADVSNLKKAVDTAGRKNK